MEDKLEKRKVENDEITQSIYVGDKEIVMGVDETCEMPYLCAFCKQNVFLESYTDCIVGDDYVEMADLFARRIQEQCENVKEEQKKITVPRKTITANMCFPLKGDLLGKVVAVKANILRPEYCFADCQLVYVTGGNGARENARGSACFSINLYSGEGRRWDRYDLQGEVKPECMPEWAKKRFAEVEKRVKVRNKGQER